MIVFLLSALLIGVVMAIMAVGVIAGRSPIKGSCGGLGAVGINSTCEICGGDPNRCDEETAMLALPAPDSASFYSADR
ncbi:MAG TPA: (Na+)-NQR maturation NqrM [Kineobactrum sp.]